MTTNPVHVGKGVNIPHVTVRGKGGGPSFLGWKPEEGKKRGVCTSTGGKSLLSTKKRGHRGLFPKEKKKKKKKGFFKKPGGG